MKKDNQLMFVPFYNKYFKRKKKCSFKVLDFFDIYYISLQFSFNFF